MDRIYVNEIRRRGDGDGDGDGDRAHLRRLEEEECAEKVPCSVQMWDQKREGNMHIEGG